MNSVANVEGKGRDDFEFALLEQSEKLLRAEKVAKYSQSVTRLATNVRGTFEAYRELVRNYQANIELVDP